MATVKWLPEALDDLKRLHAFIEPHSPAAAGTQARGIGIASSHPLSALLMLPVLLIIYIPYLAAACFAGAGLFFEFGEP